MKLRDYQSAGVAAAHDAMSKHRKVLGVAATGLGKTVMFSHLIGDRLRAMEGRAMVLAHREELIRQGAATIEAITGFSTGVEMGVERADMGWLGGDRVVVSTVQTHNAGIPGYKRMTKFDPDEFHTLIIDEAHHAASKSYRNCVDHYLQNPNCRVFGVTATPDRTDKKKLGNVFESVAFNYDILYGVMNGWLVPIKQRTIHVTDLDFSSVRTTAGDLNGKDLAAVMEEERVLHEVASPTIDIVGDRKAIVFAASVAQAERLAEIFNRHRHGSARVVSGKTDKDHRRHVLRSYKDGDFQFLINCMVFTEGFDEKTIDCVVMARPTKSRPLYAQMVGRGTRPDCAEINDPDSTAADRIAAIASSEKKCVEVLDFSGEAGRHKLITAVELLAGEEHTDRIRQRVERAAKDTPVDVLEELAREKQRELEIIEEEKFEQQLQREHIVATARYQSTERDPFNRFDVGATGSNEKWRDDVISDSQKAFLRQHHMGGVSKMKPGERDRVTKKIDAMTKGEAKDLIGSIKRRWDRGLLSEKQEALLQRYGYDTTDMKREEAGRLITELKRNGWKRRKTA